MKSKQTVQEAIIGELFSGRSSYSPWKFERQQSGSSRLGSPGARHVRTMAGNAQRVPQSVVKRVRAGGTHSAKELRRQLDYITRDEAMKSAWVNFSGIERELVENTVSTTVPMWVAGWAGAPKRGHTDHIILSFPKDTDPATAEAIAREWGRAVFASGDYGDKWRYVAALHANTEHVHAHFVVEKHGIEDGRFLSISRHSELTYDVMRELHASIASEHGLALNASRRDSRGLVDNPPRELDYRIAHEKRRLDPNTPPPAAAPLSMVERMKREMKIHSFAKEYRHLGALAGLASGSGEGDADGFMSKLSGLFEQASDVISNGEILMVEENVAVAPVDPAKRIMAAFESMVETARGTWDDIQSMEAGAERVELQAQFVELVRNMPDWSRGEAFFESHTRAVSADLDPYRLELVAELSHLTEQVAGVDEVKEDIRNRLVSAFGEIEQDLAAHGTTPDEVAERFMLGNRTLGQIEAWHSLSMAGSTAALGELMQNIDQGATDSELARWEAGGNVVEGISNRHKLMAAPELTVAGLSNLAEQIDSPDPDLRLQAAAMPALLSAFGGDFRHRIDGLREDFENPWLDQAADTKSERLADLAADHADDYLRRFDEAAAKFMSGDIAFQDRLSAIAANIVDDYEVPRTVEEAIARDQLLSSEKYHRLADVPAIERIVDQLENSLSADDLAAVRAGDVGPLREQIADPAIRAAVASELRNEGDLGDAQESESVEKYRTEIEGRSTRTSGRSAASDRADDYSL